MCIKSGNIVRVTHIKGQSLCSCGTVHLVGGGGLVAESCLTL